MVAGPSPPPNNIPDNPDVTHEHTKTPSKTNQMDYVNKDGVQGCTNDIDDKWKCLALDQYKIYSPLVTDR